MRVETERKILDFILKDKVKHETNNDKKVILNVFGVDKSGSMGGDRNKAAVIGVNKLLESIRNDNETINKVLIFEFYETNVRIVTNFEDPIPTSYEGIRPNGFTPLNQAIGEILELVESKVTNEKVLFNIFTDGGENSSRGKYADPNVLRKYIEKLTDKGFLITFMGTESETEYATATLGVSLDNVLNHDNSFASIERSYQKTTISRQVFSKSVANGDELKSFYKKD